MKKIKEIDPNITVYR